jgi:hypothetical protein
MPGFDGTGPRGQGPRTGGGFGFCSPGSYSCGAPGVVYGVGRGGIPRGGGRGFTFGGGRGRRFWRRGYAPVAPAYYAAPAPAPVSPEEELAWLQQHSQAMQDQLNQMNARITELTAEQGQE